MISELPGERLQRAIDAGKMLGKEAFYFGCWERSGHYLHDRAGRHIWDDKAPRDFPAEWLKLMDGRLLQNGKIQDVPTGRVYWTCGGLAFWYAFFWWDRSVDWRRGCNSGFYVRGFGWPEAPQAFAYACTQFPAVVARQRFPLVLQDAERQ